MLGFGFELGRVLVADSAVFAVMVVVGFEEFDDLDVGVGLGGKAVALEDFVLRECRGTIRSRSCGRGWRAFGRRGPSRRCGATGRLWWSPSSANCPP